MAEDIFYKRILIKLSGEALEGDSGGAGIDYKVLFKFGQELKEAFEVGTEIACVIGGGNIIRGTEAQEFGIDRVSADYMGMLATVINALALQNTMETLGVPTRVLSAISMAQIAEPYIRRRAIRHLEKGRMIIFAGGTGNPYFSTDTAAALRATEIKAQAFLKATNVDGIYSADPKKDPKAIRFERLTYMDMLQKGLAVMDSTAVSLCMDNNLPMVVFDMHKPGNIKQVVEGARIGTLVEGGKAGA